MLNLLTTSSDDPDPFVGSNHSQSSQVIPLPRVPRVHEVARKLGALRLRSCVPTRGVLTKSH